MLSADDLHVAIDSDAGVVRAIDGLALTLARGETFALVGESGCGKSMTALALMRLLPEAARITAGSVRLDESDGDGDGDGDGNASDNDRAGRHLGRRGSGIDPGPAVEPDRTTGAAVDLLDLPESRMRSVRGGRIGMIFQEPSTSLDPVMRVGDQIVEAIEAHTGLRGRAAWARAVEWLGRVGIAEPAERAGDYPFRMSGGQKQRVMIAMTLAAEPDYLIADEPTTALDVTLQAQVLTLLADLQRERRLGLLLISHDLAVVSGLAHRVALMYAGVIVEVAAAGDFFAAPRHPYARRLLAALPGAGRRGEPLAAIPGSVPPLIGDFAGCRFAPRCDRVFDDCRVVSPPLYDTGGGHLARCLLYRPAATGGAAASAGGDGVDVAADAPRRDAVDSAAGAHCGIAGAAEVAAPAADDGAGAGSGATVAPAATAGAGTGSPDASVGVRGGRAERDDFASGRPPAPAVAPGGAVGIDAAAGDAAAVTSPAVKAPPRRGDAAMPVAAVHAPGSAPAPPPLLDVCNLHVGFAIRRGVLQRVRGHVEAVRDVSFSIGRGRTLALVGESGCGKTTVARAVVQLLRGRAEVSGSARLDGRDLFALHGSALRAARREVQIVFQDPYASLDPRMRVAEAIEEGLLALRPELDGAGRRAAAEAALDQVGLGREALDRHPHEFSGGQRQRIAIARALAVEPRLIVCDEPTSALDVSVQAQILNLLLRLQRERGLSYLFITHNIGVVEYLADEVAVMRGGEIVESGPAGTLLVAPRHDYTRSLLAAVPRLAAPTGGLREPADVPA